MALLLVSVIAASGLASAAPSLPIRLEVGRALTSRLVNVHIFFDSAVEGLVRYTYGDCSSASDNEGRHHVVAHSHPSASDRLAWILPEETPSGLCFAAWSSDSGALLGRSAPQIIQSSSRRKRGLEKRGPYSVAMTNETGIDAWGPWFDGVELLGAANITSVDSKAAKEKHIGIVGAGMSGLMTYLVLHQAGMTNVEIIEAGHRLGGRVHTEYLSGGPFNYSYQEMGPMRFPTVNFPVPERLGWF
jgi:hypothetical protein